MKKRILALFLCVCTAFTVFTGCQNTGDIESGAAKQDFPVKIGEVTIDSKPEGVAVLSPNIADIVLALGYEINLKARSAECTQSDLKILPEVTVEDADKMKELGVTLAFTDEQPDEETAAALQDAGITVLALEPAASRSEFTTLYTQVGSALEGGNTGYQKGEKTAENIFTTLDDITRIIPNSDVPYTAVYLTDLEGSVATGDMFIDVLLSAAGFINGMKGETGGKTDVSTLLKSNPSYIFCPPGLLEQMKNTEGFQDLDAVKQNHVCEIDSQLMQLQGRSIISAVSQMAGFAHPELVENSQSTSSSSESSVDSSSETSSSESSASSQSSSSSSQSSSESSSEASSQTSSSSSSSESSSSVSVAPGTELKLGDSGDAVLKMQERLDELGYMFTHYDGTFDNGTEQAVKDFQLTNGYYTTGVAGEEFLNLLYSDQAIPAG